MPKPYRTALLIVGIFITISFLSWLLWHGPSRYVAPELNLVHVAVTPPPEPSVLSSNLQPEYETPIGPPMPPIMAPIVKSDGRLRIALVIDDCGISIQQTAPALSLPPQVTLSFLPYGLATRGMAQKAAASGHDVLLHMPMQPMGGNDPGPEALTVGLDPATARNRVTSALTKVPGAIGMNNHMGSAATADSDLMQAIMPVLRERQLLFLDSYTSAKSVAYQIALRMGVTALRRDVFLDDTITPAAITAQLQLLEKRAKKQGYAIAIGHPHPETLGALRDWIAALPGKNIDLVHVRDLTKGMNHDRDNARPLQSKSAL